MFCILSREKPVFFDADMCFALGSEKINVFKDIMWPAVWYDRFLSLFTLPHFQMHSADFLMPVI